VKIDRFVIKHTDANGVELWWRAHRSGYTGELIAAGVYGEQEARRIERIRPPQDKAIPLFEALEGLGDWTVGDYFGLRSWAAKKRDEQSREREGS